MKPIKQNREQRQITELARDWTRRRAKQLLKSIDSGKVDVPTRVRSALNDVACGAIAETDFDALARLVRDGNRQERIGAACCIANLAKDAMPLPGFPDDTMFCTGDTTDLLKTGLVKAISSKEHEVQRDLLKAFPRLRFGGDEIFPLLVKLLSATYEEVQEAAAIALRCLGIDKSSSAWEPLAKMLQGVPAVAVAACGTLAWLGSDALLAVPALVDCICDPRITQKVQIAAAKALAAIDPEGVCLLKTTDQARRNAVIETLRHAQEAGRSLRRLLLTHEANAENMLTTPSRPKMSESHAPRRGEGDDAVTEANKIAMELAEKDPNFVHGGVRKWVQKILERTGKKFSNSTVHKTALWQGTMKESNRGRTKGSTPKTVSLTPALEVATGEGERHEVLNRLIAEQQADSDLSPLEDDAPGKPRRVKQFR